MFNAIKRVLGLHDRKQLERTQKVADYVHKKKNKFTTEMAEVQQQAKLIHLNALRTARASNKLISVVDDIAAKVAIATGGFENEDKNK